MAKNHPINRRKSAAPARQQKTENVMLRGQGSNIEDQDRGSWQTEAPITSNPYFNNNFFTRWQSWVRWYETAWEARKTVDIPVDDAFRKRFNLTNISTEDANLLMTEYIRLDMDDRMKRAAKQERLLGGCALLFVLKDDAAVVKNKSADVFKAPLDLTKIQKGDLAKVNLIDINNITRPIWEDNPFSPTYDDPDELAINGIPCHTSRLMIFKGNRMFGRANQVVLQAYRLNPQGFGESVLTPLYDLLIRATGTQEAAYHLVNLSSVMLMTVENLRELSTGNNAAVDKLRDIAKQVSIYRAALMDGKNARMEQHAASFGSVPELVMTYLQILSAASDIPATRFLSQAPGGLNSTGTSDLENYYNMIGSYQVDRIKPKLMQFFNVAGASIFGHDVWLEKGKTMDIEFPPLWNLSEKEQSDMNKTIVDTYMPMYEAGMMTIQQLNEELKLRGVFISDMELKDMVEELTEAPMESTLDAEVEISKLKGE